MFLVGFMASGKTTVGSELANELNYSFCDLDRRLEDITNLTIPEYFEAYGEQRFRDQETEILRDVVGECSKKVFATGGGIVTRLKNRQLLKNQVVIYLKVPFSTIEERLQLADQQSRPLVAKNKVKDLMKLYNEREKWYEEVATVTIECDGLSLESIIKVILAEIKVLKL